MLIINQTIVENCLRLKQCMSEIEQAFKTMHMREDAVNRNASGNIYDQFTKGTYMAGHSFSLYGSALVSYGVGAKMLTTVDNNPSRGIPYINSLITIFDSETGQIEAVIDGNSITAARTAIVMAIGTKYLAREGFKSIGILGTGVQARANLIAHACMFSPDVINLWGRDKKKAQTLREEFSAISDINLKIWDSADDAVKRSEVIICATSATEPIFHGSDVREGTHIGLVGPMTPKACSVPISDIASYRLFVDSKEKFAYQWSNSSWIRLEAEIDRVISQRHKGRVNSSDTTIFKAFGMAFEDLICARMVYREAVETKQGIEVSLNDLT